jgi:hypothetical protein
MSREHARDQPHIRMFGANVDVANHQGESKGLASLLESEPTIAYT